MLYARLLHLIIVLLVVQVSLAQETKGIDFSERKNYKNQRLQIEGVSYTDFEITRQIHKNFTLNYKISSNVFLEIHGYRHKSLAADVFGGHFISRVYVTNRLFMYTGVQSEYSAAESGLKSMSYLESLNGIGYDFTDNFSMRVDKGFGLSKVVPKGYSNPNSFNIRSKFRF